MLKDLLQRYSTILPSRRYSMKRNSLSFNKQLLPTKLYYQIYCCKMIGAYHLYHIYVRINYMRKKKGNIIKTLIDILSYHFTCHFEIPALKFRFFIYRKCENRSVRIGTEVDRIIRLSHDP